MTTTVFETTDVELAEQVLSRVYGRVQLAVTGGSPFLRFSRYPLGPVQLHRLTVGMWCNLDGVATGMVAFGRVAAGSVTCRTGAGSQNRTYDMIGETFLAGQHDLPWHATLGEADVELAMVQPGLLAEVANPGRNGAPAQSIRFSGGDPLSAEAAAWWTGTYDYVRDHLLTGPVSGMPLVAGNAARLLAATALSVFPHDGWDGAGAEERRQTQPVTLRRAVDFIEINCRRSIDASDIADASQVTLRSLQLTFRRYLDTTPMAYLRGIRLERAHRELIEADPASTTVAAVAERWGFRSHSRFTAHYRATYGRPPSAALHHRP